MVSDRDFIFHVYIPWGKNHSLVPKSRSSVKVIVKYQGHSFRKDGRCGAIRVSRTHLVAFIFKYNSIYYPSKREKVRHVLTKSVLINPYETRYQESYHIIKNL